MTRTPLSAPIAAPPLAPIPDPAPAPAPAPPTRSRLGVVAREFTLVLSRTSLPAGTAIVQLQNAGEDAHDLRIERTDGSGAPVDVPAAQAGEVSSTDAALSAGGYRLYCTLPGHDALGMHATLAVGP